MYEAVFRVVLIVTKPMPGGTFEEALAAAQKVVSPSSRGMILTDAGKIKGEIDDWGFHLVSVDEQGAYSTE